MFLWSDLGAKSDSVPHDLMIVDRMRTESCGVHSWISPTDVGGPRAPVSFTELASIREVVIPITRGIRMLDRAAAVNVGLPHLKGSFASLGSSRKGVTSIGAPIGQGGHK